MDQVAHEASCFETDVIHALALLNHLKLLVKLCLG